MNYEQIRNRMDWWKEESAKWSNCSEVDAYHYPTVDPKIEGTLKVQDSGKTIREMSLLSEVLSEPWKSAMDFGCGLGRNFVCFESGNDPSRYVVGVDADHQRARIAEEEAKGRNFACSVVGGDLRLLERAPAESFDVITCVQVLGHVTHAATVDIITQFNRLLRSGGLCVLCIPVVGEQYNECSSGWSPPSDFLHVVNLECSPYEDGFRTELTKAEFDEQAIRSGRNKLPVRSYYLQDMPQSCSVGLPYRISDSALPPSLDAARGELEVEQSLVYSIHRLAPCDERAAIGDCMVVLRK